jgi:parallel beta-helix repeat protein
MIDCTRNWVVGSLGYNQVTTCSLAGNDADGIQILLSNKNVIADNFGRNNAGSCVYLQDAAQNTVKSNACLRGIYDIALANGDANLIDNNHITGSADASISLGVGSVNNKVRKNQLTKQTGPIAVIAVDLTATPDSTPNTYVDNVCETESGAVPARACVATPAP